MTKIGFFKSALSALFLFGLLIGVNAASAQQRPPVVIMTWNVENFFDSEDDPMKDDTVPSPDEVQNKLLNIAFVIKSINPDLIALQEVENLDLLNRLNEKGGLKYPNAVLIEGNDGRGIDVGILTRINVIAVKSHKNDPLPQLPDVPPDFRFSRDCLEVRLDANGTPLIALINHFISKSGGEAATLTRRESQARRVREIVNELQTENSDAQIAVIGDLNDTPDSIPIRALIKKKPKTSKLYDPTVLVPSQDRFSFIFRGQGELIDYVLVTQNLKPLIRKENVRILHTPETDPASDHDPIIVGISFP